MTNTNDALSLPMGPLKVALGSLVAIGLLGCDGLASFTAKPDKKAEETVAAEAPAEPAPIPAAKEKKPVEKPKRTALYEWKGDGRPVTRIVVDTNAQKARFYAGEDEVGWTTVATGVSKHPTPTGQFQVMEKVANKRSNLYGKAVKNGKVVKRSVKVGRDAIPAGATFQGAKMPYFMRLTYDGVGLHAGPIPRPGSPASHGCIRMPSKFAPLAFKHVSEGTAVEIVGKGPSYGDYVAKQRAIAARRAAEKKRLAAQKAAEKPAASTAAKAASEPKAAPAAAASIAATDVVTETAKAKDSSAATQTLETSPPRETHMRAPADEGIETRAAANQASEPSAPGTSSTSGPEPARESPQAAEATQAPAETAVDRPATAAEASPPAVAAESAAAPSAPAAPQDVAPKPAEPASAQQVSPPAPAPTPTPTSSPVVEKPAVAPKPEAAAPAQAAPAPAPTTPAASAPEPAATDSDAG